jgi:hypothetical protein
LTRFWEMLKTETSFWRDFGKCWKRKREQKRGLLESHETTIREQKRCYIKYRPTPSTTEQSHYTLYSECAFF